MKKHYYLLLIAIFAISMGFPETIYAQESVKIEDLMTEVSKNFHLKHSKAFASEFVTYRTTEQNGRYVGFLANSGIMTNINYAPTKITRAFEDIKSIFTKTISTFTTDSFDENGQMMKHKSNVPNNIQTNKIKLQERLKKYYIICQSEILSIMLNTMVDGPLNKTKESLFKYSIAKEYSNSDNDKIYDIKFTNKDWTSFQNTRIMATGKIVYNKTKGYVEKIFFDKGYVDYRRKVFVPKVSSANPISLRDFELAFELKNNYVYPKYAKSNVEYVVAQSPMIDINYHIPERLNPIETKLKISEVVEFKNSVNISPKQINTLKLKLQSEYITSLNYAPYQELVWKDMVFEYLDFEKIKKDLNVTGDDIYVQAERNNGKPLPPFDKNEEFESEAAKKEVMEIRERTRKMAASRYAQIFDAYYPILFGKDYQYKLQYK